MSTWLNVELDDDLEAMFEELKESEQIDGNSKMTRELIKWAHNEHVDGEYWYDPREERMTPIDTEERQEIFFRYDNPAINPDHISKWPRDKREKAELLAAICRYVEATTSGEIKKVIKATIGEGDPVTVDVSGMDETKTKGRNIVEYLSRVRDILAGSKQADNLPDESVEVDDDVFGEWLQAEVPEETQSDFDNVGDWVDRAERLAEIRPDEEPLSRKVSEGESLIEVLEDASRDDDVDDVKAAVEELKTALDEMADEK